MLTEKAAAFSCGNFEKMLRKCPNLPTQQRKIYWRANIRRTGNRTIVSRFQPKAITGADCITIDLPKGGVAA
jgi:hypothetical protein